jgi:hypothetical protein
MNFAASSLSQRVFVSLPVREALAVNSLQGARRTFPIVNAELGPVGIAEIEFR